MKVSVPRTSIDLPPIPCLLYAQHPHDGLGEVRPVGQRFAQQPVDLGLHYVDSLALCQVPTLQVGLELDLRLEVLEQHQELEKDVPAGHNAGLYCHEHKDCDGND